MTVVPHTEKKILFESIFFHWLFALCASFPFAYCRSASNNVDDVVNRYWFLFICLKFYFSLSFSLLNSLLQNKSTAVKFKLQFQFSNVFRPYWQPIICILKSLNHSFFWIRTEHTNCYNWIWMHTDIHMHGPIHTHIHTHTRARYTTVRNGQVRYDTTVVFSNFFIFSLFTGWRPCYSQQIVTWKPHKCHITFDGKTISAKHLIRFAFVFCSKKTRKSISYFL